MRDMIPAFVAAEGLPVVDGQSPGDTVIGHPEEVARPYREQVEQARRRGPRKVRNVPEPATSAVPQLPMSGVAQTVLGRHMGELRATVAGLERFLSIPPIGPGGQPVPHMIEQRQAAREELEATVTELERLASFTDEQTRQWAYDHGCR